MTYSENEWLEKLNQLIENNLDNPNFTTDDYYRELGLSRSHMFRLVKEHSQLSISLYIRQRKLLKAKELLDNSDLKIAEISYQIGMDSPQSFSKFFTKEFGISPMEYRKLKLVPDEKIISDVVGLEAIVVNNISQNLSKKYLYFGLSITVLLIFAVGFFLLQKGSKALNTEGVSETGSNENSIAILPFKSLGAPETAFFVEGAMEQVYSSLALIESLKVISRSSSSLFQDSKKTIPQIAQELQVSYILEGSVLQIGNKVRVSLDLIQGDANRVVWTKSHDGNTEDVIAFLNNVTKEIAVKLNQRLSTQLTNQLDKVPTAHPDANNEYLQGRQLLLTREKEKIEASLLKFDEAIAIDPNFSMAYANKASAYFALGDFQHMSLDSSFRLAEKAALTAIRIDSENGMAYGVLANIYRNQNKWEQAITTFQIALKYSPNDVQINYWYSLVMRSIGKFDDAIQYSRKAVALDPLQSLALVGHIGNCSYAKRFDLAQEAIKNGEILFDNSFFFHWAVAFYYLNLEDYDKALKEFKRSRELNAQLRQIGVMIAYTQAQLGQIESANIYLQMLPQTVDNYPAFATVYAGLGNKEQCLKYLELGIDKNLLPDYIKVSPVFTFLHNDKRFQAILQKVGLLNPVFNIQK